MLAVPVEAVLALAEGGYALEVADGSGNELANRIWGNAGANELEGDDGNDTLAGDAGNDTLVGGAGVDSMVGGIGNDSYEVDVDGDVTVETSTAPTESRVSRALMRSKSTSRSSVSLSGRVS